MKLITMVVLVYHLIVPLTVPPCGIRCRPQPAIPTASQPSGGMQDVDVPPDAQGPMTADVAWAVMMNNTLYDIEGHQQ